MKTVFIFVLALAVSSAAQSGPATELYGPVSAVQVFNSLGTNITSTNEWEYQAAREAHMTWGRFDCSWQDVEIQRLPANTSGGYRLPKACASGLQYGKEYGVHQIVDALYGAPYSPVATAVTSSDSPIGSTQISLRTTSGSLSAVVAGQSYLSLSHTKISAKHAYAGTLISAKSGNTVTLASALTADIPPGSTVTLNLQLYPPVSITPGTSYLTNPSIRAYGNYVHFLQTEVAASGLPGRVSIWNEPSWAGDPWDDATNLYDHPPAEDRIKGTLGVELAYYAATLPPVAGASLDNGYTNKTGFASLLVHDRRTNLGSAASIRQTVASESIHPYGNNPEDGAWIPGCIPAHATPSTRNQVFKDCSPVGAVQGSNSKWLAALNAAPENTGGPDIGITETGLCRCNNPAVSETAVTRFDIRQFLAFAGDGVHPIVFYRLAGDPPFAWMRPDHSPFPVYTAFQNLMSDIALIAHPPVTSSPACMVPRITSYSGTYPIAVTTLVGAQEGARADSFLVYTWQRSYTSGQWYTLASPENANLSMLIPGGLKVESVKDTVTSTSVAFRVNGRTLTYPVADNPVEVLLAPASPEVTRITCN